jgi:MFS transporter, ACS family, tartrate transporter
VPSARVPSELSIAHECTADRALAARVFWRLVPFLFLLYVVAYLDRINVGFAALQMRQRLNFSDAVYGLAAGMFFAGYFTFQVPSNLLLERFGARRWIATLMVAWGLVSCSMALVTTPKQFYILRFALGLTEAGFFPGVILYMKRWFPEATRARTVAAFMTAGPISGVIGGPISGAILQMHIEGPIEGWQRLFLMEGLPAILLGVVVYFYLTDHPQDAAWLNPDERARLIATLDAETKAYAGNAKPPSAFSAFGNPRVWVLSFVYLGLNFCSYGMSFWVPSLIRSLSGISDFLVGALTAVPYFAAAVVMVLSGLHSDRTGERRWHVAAPAFAGAVAFTVASSTTSLWPMIIAVGLAVVCVNAMIGPYWAMPTAILSGAAAAPGIALVNSVGNLGGFFGPYLIGQLKTSTGDFRGGLLLAAGVLIAAGALALSIRMKKPATAAVGMRV